MIQLEVPKRVSNIFLNLHKPKKFKACYLSGMFQVIEEGKEASVEFYDQWVKDVIKTVPKERLLIFNVKEGWEPLCKFLDVPIPNQVRAFLDMNYERYMIMIIVLFFCSHFQGLMTLLI